ncbi:MAG: PD40 domain-containing protein [Bryobacterales bacterium]|nr:PD40 domain-containing protein [Bryobacterales bacterium]
MLNRSRPKPPAASQPIPLTGLAGRLSGPAFSPDARQVAFAWTREDRPSRGEIHVKLIGSAETLQLTNGDTLDEFPRWSPDGKSVIFTRQQDQDAALWQVPALGGTPKRITSLGAAPLYGYSFRRPFDVLPSGGFLASIRDPARGWIIVRIDENEGSGEALTSSPKDHFDRNPTASPDGRSFVFVRSESASPRELHVQSLAGGPSVRVVQDAWVTSAAWTPDSQSVLFCGSFRGGNGIWMTPAVGGEPRLVYGTSATLHDITLSPTGDLAAYAEENPRVDLRSAPLRRPGEPRPLITSARIHDSPRFSPDGKRLTFCSNRTGAMQVWIANAEGRGAHPLTSGTYPSWSPDGKRLVYLPRGGIYAIPSEGGVAENVLAPDRFFVTRPVWSPDGKSIFFESSRGGPIEIWKTPVTPSRRKPVRITRGGGIHPQIHGAFVYYRKRHSGTMRSSLEGGQKERMGPEGTAHAAMPGGLYVLTQDRQLLHIDYATRAVNSLRHLDKAAGGSAIAISGDETSIVYAYQQNAGHEIMLVRDFAWH